MTQAEFDRLSEKMAKDEAFKKALFECHTEKEVFDLYKKNGYTDLEFPDFVIKFKDQVVTALQQSGELSEEELQMVVGGSFFGDIGNFFKKAASAVYDNVIKPVVGAVGSVVSTVGNVLTGGSQQQQEQKQDPYGIGGSATVSSEWHKIGLS